MIEKAPTTGTPRPGPSGAQPRPRKPFASHGPYTPDQNRVCLGASALHQVFVLCSERHAFESLKTRREGRSTVLTPAHRVIPRFPSHQRPSFLQIQELAGKGRLHTNDDGIVLLVRNPTPAPYSLQPAGRAACLSGDEPIQGPTYNNRRRRCRRHRRIAQASTTTQVANFFFKKTSQKRGGTRVP